MKFAIFGLGYVGLANGLLLARRYEVVAVDTNSDRVHQVNERTSPLVDAEIGKALRQTSLLATTDPSEALANSDFAIVATPTNYDEETHYFDTRSVESVISQVAELSPSTTVIIKSTIPVGFTERIRQRHPGIDIHFSPEFLREGRALHDNLYPSRIIVSDETPAGIKFAEILRECALNEPEVITCHSTEAEAVKLFSNTFLAMRVAFFNELDTFAMTRGLKAAKIIKGVSLDPRVGDHYNNPSFGYGGYCLPKDTRQLLANYKDVPQSLIGAIVESNELRKIFIADKLLEENPKTVGVYKLAMKSGSDNSRSSAIFGVIDRLTANGVRVIVYDSTNQIEGLEFVEDFEDFCEQSDLILANRMAPALQDVLDKVRTRDAFARD